MQEFTKVIRSPRMSKKKTTSKTKFDDQRIDQTFCIFWGELEMM